MRNLAVFVPTRWTQVSKATGTSPESQRALAWLCECYWHPLHAHAVRRGTSDADDAIQDFLSNLIARGSFALADANRGRFRTWLLACLDNFLVNRLESQHAAKRGGGLTANAPALEELVAAPQTLDSDRIFAREWAMTMLETVQKRLVGDQGSIEASKRFAILRRFLANAGDVTSYAEAGLQLSLSESAVKVAVFRLRQRYRELLRREIAETLVNPSEKDIDAELDDLLSALAS